MKLRGSVFFSIVISMIICCTTSYAATKFPAPILQNNDYNGYIQEFLKNEIHDTVMKLSDKATMAIALKNAGLWDKAEGLKIRETQTIGDYPSSYYGLFYALIKGDLVNAEKISTCTDDFDIVRGSEFKSEVKKTIAVLNNSGYKSAANALKILMSDFEPDHAIAYFSFSEKDRKIVFEPMRKSYGSAWGRFVFTTFEMMVNDNAANTLDKNVLFSFLTEQAADQITLGNVERLMDAGKKDSARLLAKAMASAAAPADAGTRNNIVDLMVKKTEYATAQEIIAKSLVEVPEPYRREIRIMNAAAALYIAKRSKEAVHPDITELEKDINPLQAGEALLTNSKLAPAVEVFTLILKDNAQPLEIRLAAWRAFLDCDPANALPMADALITEIAASKDKHPLFVWLGHQLDNVVIRDLAYRVKSPYPGINNSPMRITLADDALLTRTRIREVKGWSRQVLDIMQKIMDIDQNALLAPDRPTFTSQLRITMAILYSLNAEDDKAIEIITRGITCEYAAPKEGWPRGSVTLGDEAKPQQFKLPDPLNISRSFSDLLTRLAAYDADVAARDGAEVPVSPLYAMVISQNAKALPANAYFEMMFALTELGKEVDTLVTRIEENKFEEGKDAAVIQDSLEAIKKNMADKSVAHNAMRLLNPGIDAALTHAKTPQMVAALVNLIEVVLDAYLLKTDDKTGAKQYANWIVRNNSLRTDIDIKPYVDRLKEKYMQ